MAISTVSRSTVRPHEVFAYVTDASRFSEWQDGVVSGHMEATAHQRSAIGASPPGGSDSPSERSPPRSPTSTRPAPGAFGASTGRSAPP